MRLSRLEIVTDWRDSVQAGAFRTALRGQCASAPWFGRGCLARRPLPPKPLSFLVRRLMPAFVPDGPCSDVDCFRMTTLATGDTPARDALAWLQWWADRLFRNGGARSHAPGERGALWTLAATL